VIDMTTFEQLEAARDLVWSIDKELEGGNT